VVDLFALSSAEARNFASFSTQRKRFLEWQRSYVETVGTVEWDRGVKDVWQQQIQQGPQLVEVVLKRRAGEQEHVQARELPKDLGGEGLVVLEAVGLVDNDVAPRNRRTEELLVGTDHLVGRDAYVERKAAVDPLGL